LHDRVELKPYAMLMKLGIRPTHGRRTDPRPPSHRATSFWRACRAVVACAVLCLTLLADGGAAFVGLTYGAAHFPSLVTARSADQAESLEHVGLLHPSLRHPWLSRRC
jgi:hypothetical protein